MSIFKKIFGKKEVPAIKRDTAAADSDLSDFNMFMDGGTERQDSDLNEVNEHLNFVSGGASMFKRRL